MKGEVKWIKCFWVDERKCIRCVQDNSILSNQTNIKFEVWRVSASICTFVRCIATKMLARENCIALADLCNLTMRTRRKSRTKNHIASHNCVWRSERVYRAARFASAFSHKCILREKRRRIRSDENVHNKKCLITFFFCFPSLVSFGHNRHTNMHFKTFKNLFFLRCAERKNS